MFETVLSKNAKKSLAILGKSRKPGNFLEVDIANVKDIAPMKIAAISDRGSKKDFIDLYFIIEIEKTYDQNFCASDAIDIIKRELTKFKIEEKI